MSRHGIERKEWERRFTAQIMTSAGLVPGQEDIAAAELESWPERDEQPGGNEDWLTELPEAAAMESLSNWAD